jgi:sec-independent protein translocase protein TatB
MEFLGIGAPELIFIIVIALILLGPKDMQKAGKTIGVWLNNLVRSDGWRLFQRTSRELRNLPTNLMREANLDLRNVERDLRNTIEPPSIAGPRAPLASSPVDPTPPPRPELNPEPNASNPPDADLPPQPKSVNPPDQED